MAGMKCHTADITSERRKCEKQKQMALFHNNEDRIERRRKSNTVSSIHTLYTQVFFLRLFV